MMANAINDRPTGVTANVRANDESGQSTLELTAVSTGGYNSFTIRDAEGSNAVEATGVDNVVVEAGDMRFIPLMAKSGRRQETLLI